MSSLHSTANRAFLGFASSAVLAANNSHVQLFNPAASGIIVAFRGVTATMDVVGAPSLRFNTAALTTLIGTGQSHLLSGPASVAQLRSQTNGALLGTELARVRIPADSRHDFVFAEDEILLPAGYGIIVAPFAQNAAIFASFKWREFPA